jgi:predicted transcriptional regulator
MPPTVSAFLDPGLFQDRAGGVVAEAGSLFGGHVFQASRASGIMIEHGEGAVLLRLSLWHAFHRCPDPVSQAGFTPYLTQNNRGPTFKEMEVHLAENQEAQLNELAVRTGRGTDELLQRAVARMLEYDTRFIEAVEEGRASARRGDLLEHDEVVERIEQMFGS